MASNVRQVGQSHWFRRKALGNAVSKLIHGMDNLKKGNSMYLRSLRVAGVATKLCFSLAIVVLTGGCAFSTVVRYLEPKEEKGWSLENGAALPKVDYQCPDGESLSAFQRRYLARDGKTYFAFFAVPISNADVIDRAYDGVSISIQKTSRTSQCMTDDVSIRTRNLTHLPRDAARDPNANEICIYTWKLPVESLERFSLTFDSDDYCRAPDLRFVLRTETNYTYDALSGRPML